MKWDDFLKRRTTRKDYKKPFLMFMAFVVVLTLVFTSDFSKIITNIVDTGFSVMFPYENFKNNNLNNLTNGNIFGNSATNSSSNTVLKTDLPQDVILLLTNAEKKYANSSNDGIIREVDYSTQNATSEFNGIFIRNTTQNQTINIDNYLNRKVYATINKNEPAVLIYHTHSSETYELLDRGFYTLERSSLSTNTDENMIKIGEEICKVLEENGFKTIHDTTVYDEQYSGAYERARENVSKILKQYPSIQIVLDIHRDSIYLKDGTRIKPTTIINDEKVSQISVVTGCEDGSVTDFPNWEKNLTFALKLQQQLITDNPKIARPMLLCSRKYNMDLIPCALTIEIGTDANTLVESIYSARIFADSLSKLLEEYVK